MVDYTQFDASFTKGIELKNRCGAARTETFFVFFVFRRKSAKRRLSLQEKDG